MKYLKTVSVMKHLSASIILLLIVAGLSHTVQAQATVTFNLNLKPQLEDSSFVPGEHEVHISGSLYPLGMNRTKRMTDTAPVDSIYSVEIRFNRNHTGKNLQFTYILRTDEGDQREDYPRSLNLQKGTTELDPIYFNAYAW